MPLLPRIFYNSKVQFYTPQYYEPFQLIIKYTPICALELNIVIRLTTESFTAVNNLIPE